MVRIYNRVSSTSLEYSLLQTLVASGPVQGFDRLEVLGHAVILPAPAPQTTSSSTPSPSMSSPAKETDNDESSNSTALTAFVLILVLAAVMVVIEYRSKTMNRTKEKARAPDDVEDATILSIVGEEEQKNQDFCLLVTSNCSFVTSATESI